MYIELFVKKYKEAILINLDICMKQAMQHLQAGSWEAIRSLKLDTFFSNPESTEEVKKSIKKIYELQTIDFSQFSSKPKDTEGFSGKFMEDLLAEIAKADATNNMVDKAKKRRGSSVARMLCNETLDLSIINVNDGNRAHERGLASMLDSDHKKEKPLLPTALLKSTEFKDHRPHNGRTPKKKNISPKKSLVAASRSADLTPTAFARRVHKPSLKESDITDKSNLELIAQLENLTTKKQSRQPPGTSVLQKPPQQRSVRGIAVNHH